MRIELLEYGSSEVELSPEDALELSRIAGNTLSITLGSQPGWYRVTATSHVGNVVTPAVTVQIRPKVATEHLFLMLGVSPPTAFGARTGYGDDADDRCEATARCCLHVSSSELRQADRDRPAHGVVTLSRRRVMR